MFALDLRTIVLLLSVLSVLQAVVLILFTRLVGRRYPGVGWWACGSVINATAFILLALRGAIPDLWSIVVANIGFVAALAISLVGTNRFLELPRPLQQAVAWAIVALTAALFVPFTYLYPSVSARTVIVNSALGVLNLLMLWSMLSPSSPGHGVARRFTAAICAIGAGWALTRAGLVLGGDRLEDVFSPTLVQTLGFLITLAINLLWAGSVVALTMQRLLRDLRTAREAERVALEHSALDAERRADEARELLDALTEANRLLREREQIFRLTFDRSPIGAALVTLDGRFVRVNEALERISGYNESELLRRDVFTVVSPAGRAFASANAQALVEGEERVSLEVEGLRADGQPIWMQVTAGLVRDDDEPLHILALVEDITERRAAEQQRALILRVMPDLFWFKDLQGRYVFWSDAFLAFHKRSAAEVAGRTAHELFPPALADGMVDSDAIVMATREPFRRELATPHPEGGERWTETTKFLVTADGNTPIGTVGMSRDITARKQAEAALRRSNERLELALWGAELGLWDWHIPSGTLESNTQLPALIGLAPEQFSPALEIWSSRTHPDDLDLVRAAFDAVISGPEDVLEVEFRIHHVDGSVRWHAARGRAVERGDDGAALRLIGITRDVTARRNAEEQLAARENLLRTISDNLPEGMIYQLERDPDGRGRFRYVSAGVRQLWGVSPEQVLADPEALWGRIHPEDRAGFDQAVRHAQLTRSMFEHEMRVCLPDGRTRWSYSRSTPQLLPDGRMLRSGVELDITARKETEAALERRVHELTVLYQITHALTSWTNLAEGLPPVVTLLRRVLRAGAVTVWDYDAERRQLVALAGLADANPPCFRPADLDGLPALLSRAAPRLYPLDPSHQLLGAERGPLRQVLLLPLRARQAPVGLLCVCPGSDEHVFTPEDVALLQTVAGVLASALDNAHLFAQARSTAAEQERRRLARELHDSVSQALFAASRIAESLPQLWELDPVEGREALSNLHHFTTSGLAEMRALLVELRPPVLVEAPLHETLAVLVPAARARGLTAIRTVLDEAPLLPAEVQVAIYRVAQEALNNVVKHARARSAMVTLEVAPPVMADEPWQGTLTLAVTDDGRGFDLGAGAGAHYGLTSMRERAVEIGAKLELNSVPDGGTQLRLRWQGEGRQSEGQASFALAQEGDTQP